MNIESNRYNILFVSGDNNKVSGAFRSMLKLASILKQDYKCNVTILLPNSGDGEKLINELGIDYITIKSYGWAIKSDSKHNVLSHIKYGVKLILNRVSIQKIKRLIKKNKIDIIHINATSSYVGAVAALKMRIPFVWHLREFLKEDHGYEIYNEKRGYALMRQANRVVTISESLNQKYVEIIGKDKLQMIHNGIDTKVFLYEGHQLFTADKVKIIIVGKVTSSKGQHTAIEACGKLLEKGIDSFSLDIIGSTEKTDAGQYMERLAQLVHDYKLEKNVKFVGFSDNVEDYYRNADIVLVCSHFEAFGRVTVEAMLSGALVIGADTAATKELIQNEVTGLWYKEGDSDSLYKKIKYAIENKDKMRKIANYGQEYMSNNMTAECNAEKIYKMYQTII